MNYLTHFFATWIDIVVGSIAFSIMTVCVVSIINKYVQFVDEKEEQSEMDRLRDTMINNKSEM